MIRLELSEAEKKGLTEEEIEIAKARKLEFLVLPHVRRNINFFYAGANIPKKAKAYNNVVNQEEISDAMQGKNPKVSVVCKPFCEMIAGILKENNLNAETVSCDSDMFRHTDVLLTTSSGKQYIINYLEDIENVQTGMKTPDFASKAYYERRYKKFEGGLTTDGKSLESINFLTEEQVDKIDKALGYKKYGLYMDDVIKQIQKEFKDFRTIMVEIETLNEIFKLERENGELTEGRKQEIQEEIFRKYQEMSDNQILEQKLEWLFNYFNQRMDLSGHTDFVMYYSRLLLARVLEPEEYKKLTRYDGFAYKKDIPENSQIKEILDYENSEEKDRIRFCLLKLGDTVYAYSTKPNSYKKLSMEEVQEISEYARFSKAQKPSELVLNLCDRGNAVPLLFHPLGSKMLNKRAELIDSNLSEEQRKKEIDKLAASIRATDGEITSITIPYPNGDEKYIYITKENEFAVRKKDGTVTVYHYDEEKDTFNAEIIKPDEER